jgi:hypothetical protein
MPEEALKEIALVIYWAKSAKFSFENGLVHIIQLADVLTQTSATIFS